MTKMCAAFVALVLVFVTGMPAAAATIGFDSLATNAPLTTFVESGFTVSAASGNWQTFIEYGNPAPFIEFIRQADQPATSASIQVTAGGSALPSAPSISIRASLQFRISSRAF
jgi:hypothetical protein